MFYFKVDDYIPTFEEEFNETNNAIYVIQSFIFASEVGIDVPAWVLEFILKAFQEFIYQKGNKSLDNIFFGLKKGRGATKLYDNLFRYLRDDLLCKEVIQLKAIFDLPYTETFALVALCYNKNPEWGPDWFSKELGGVDSGTVKNIYYRCKLKESSHYVNSINRLKSFTPELKRAYLKGYLGEKLYNKFPANVLSDKSMSKLENMLPPKKT